MDFPQNRRIFADMKRILAISISLLCALTAFAQNLAIGERTPPLHPKYRQWINGHVPQNCEYTYIGFVHSASIPCIGGVGHIDEIADGIDNLRILIFTKESEDNVSGWLKLHAAGRSGVACRSEYAFRSCGVNYAPFGVIIDARRRVIWFGNPKQLSREKLMKLTQSNKKHKIKCRSLK